MGLFDKIKSILSGTRPDDKISDQTGVNLIPLEERCQAIMELLEPFKRDAFLPITETVLPSHSACSKFGGLPYLNQEEDWPVCKKCNAYMSLFLQLNQADLPIFRDNSLVQVFHCQDEDCEAYYSTWEYHSEGALVRRYTVEGNSAEFTPQALNVLSERKITGWRKVADYPCADELESLNILVEIDDDVFDQLYEVDVICKSTDKLGGWPFWIQNVEYAGQKTDGKIMNYLFQICSNENLDHIFGDMGVAYLFQSPDSAEDLAFGWSCY